MTASAESSQSRMGLGWIEQNRIIDVEKFLVQSLKKAF